MEANLNWFTNEADNGAMPQRRCPYLEQILKSKIGPAIRFRADCHVDHKTHQFVYLRNPAPPCLTDFESCVFYRRQFDEENRMINRYTD